MLTRKYLLYGSVTGIILLLTSFFLAFDLSIAKDGTLQLEKLLNYTKYNAIERNLNGPVVTKQISHLHSDLFTRNLTNINITNFQFIINNNISWRILNTFAPFIKIPLWYMKLYINPKRETVQSVTKCVS